MTKLTGRLREIFDGLKAAGQFWLDDQGSSKGASLAYYGIFSLIPLLDIIFVLAGPIFGQGANKTITDELSEIFGLDATHALQAILTVGQNNPQSTLTMVVAVVMLFLGASGAFVELRTDLVNMWQLPTLREKGIVRFFHNYLMSFLLTFGLIILFLLTLAFSTVFSLFQVSLAHTNGHWIIFWLSPILFFIFTTLFFALVFKILSQSKISWRNILLGSVLVAVLFNFGKMLLRVYLDHSNLKSAFGTASTVIVLLLWLYYSAQIFLFGAEVVRVCQFGTPDKTGA